MNCRTFEIASNTAHSLFCRLCIQENTHFSSIFIRKKSSFFMEAHFHFTTHYSCKNPMQIRFNDKLFGLNDKRMFLNIDNFYLFNSTDINQKRNILKSIP